MTGRNLHGWANPAVSDQGRRLKIEWTAQLRQPTRAEDP